MTQALITVSPIRPRYMRQSAAAAYLGVKVSYFRLHVDVKPKELPGSGRRKVLVWDVDELDAWVQQVSDPKSRKSTNRKAS